MTAKDYLRRARHSQQRVSAILDQIEELQSLRERVTTCVSGMPRGGCTDTLTLATDRIIALEARLTDAIHNLVSYRLQAAELIGSVESPDEQLVLERVYLCGRSWSSVANEMGLTVSGVHKLHGRALQDIK